MPEVVQIKLKNKQRKNYNKHFVLKTFFQTPASSNYQKNFFL